MLSDYDRFVSSSRVFEIWLAAGEGRPWIWVMRILSELDMEAIIAHGQVVF